MDPYNLACLDADADLIPKPSLLGLVAVEGFMLASHFLYRTIGPIDSNLAPVTLVLLQSVSPQDLA